MSPPPAHHDPHGAAQPAPAWARRLALLLLVPAALAAVAAVHRRRPADEQHDDLAEAALRPATPKVTAAQLATLGVTARVSPFTTKFRLTPPVRRGIRGGSPYEPRPAPRRRA